MRNEEKTYDYKGLLISRWRGVAWGSGVETGGTRGTPWPALYGPEVPDVLLYATHYRFWPCGNKRPALKDRYLKLHDDATYSASTGPGCSLGRVGPVPVPLCATQLSGQTRQALLYSSRSDGRLFLFVSVLHSAFFTLYLPAYCSLLVSMTQKRV